MGFLLQVWCDDFLLVFINKSSILVSFHEISNKITKIIAKWVKLSYWQCNRTIKSITISWFFPDYGHLTFLRCHILILTTRWSLLPLNKIFRSTRIIFWIMMMKRIINLKSKTHLGLCYKNHNQVQVLERKSVSVVHVKKHFV